MNITASRSFWMASLFVFGLAVFGMAHSQPLSTNVPVSNPLPATSEVVPLTGPQPSATETPAAVIDGSTTETLMGKPVQSVTGDNMGRIVDVIVDHAGMMRAAIIDFGGFLGVGTRKIAVDWRVLHFPPDGHMEKLIADLPRVQLQTAPVYKAGEPIVVMGRSDAPPAPSSDTQEEPGISAPML